MINSAKELLCQLNNLIHYLEDDAFRTPIEILNGATIGQHVRHSIEFFLCLLDQKESGSINYDLRKRDMLLETNTAAVCQTMAELEKMLEANLINKELLLHFDYGESGSRDTYVLTNYFRELVYAIEHTVHHMALIKIGLKEICPDIQVPPSFGVAASTIRHRTMVNVEEGNAG